MRPTSCTAKLRGPAKNLTVLATAFDDPAQGGAGRHEPVLMTIAYGRGRVFHTTLGHNVPEMQSVAFIVTFQRGAEWAATGKVTQQCPPISRARSAQDPSVIDFPPHRHAHLNKGHR